MRWGQVAVALSAALAVGWMAPRVAGVGVEVAAGAGLVAYVLVRVGLAAIGRTRHYIRSGASPGRGRTTCGSCGNRIWRLSGDWILTCKRCGWRPGLPGLRWATRSVPSRQLRRSVEWQRVALLGVAGLVVFAGLPSQVPAAPEVGTTDAPATTAHDTATAIQTSTSSSTDTDRRATETSQQLDEREIERYLVEYINERRARHDLDLVERDDGLAQIATYHSEDMAERGYFAHDSPDGETMADRYDRFGYDCRAPTGGNTYYTGAENIAYTYAFESLRTDYASDVYHDSERDVARGLVQGWMNSTGHRENILTPAWDDIGHGIYITSVDGKVKVYATQNFC